MKDIKQHAPGTFCWIELGTKDTAEAKKFYSGLFGWSAKDLEGPGMIYTMFQLEGQDIAGLYELNPKQPTPPGWLSYVSVTNADETTAQVRELGGKIILPPMDIPEAGRAALFSDPQGAVFGIWQPGHHTGAGITGEHGAMVWNELVSPDTTKSTTFYTKLFGWNLDKMPMERFEYTIFKLNDKGFAGMLPIPPDAKGLAPNWTVYFAVADCDAAARKADSLGGNIMMPPTDIPDTGRFAILRDPQGALFAILHPQPR
jgi:predicted enzyme related to lactoylglutathione lyase